jgi:hypothetical protein
VPALEIELDENAASAEPDRLRWPPDRRDTDACVYPPLTPRLVPIMVACVRHDLDEVRNLMRGLVTAVPEWYHDRAIVRSLVEDTSFAFFLGHPRVVLDTLGGTPEDLVVMNRQHQLQQLIEARR